jgi:hypothetical protein
MFREQFFLWSYFSYLSICKVKLSWIYSSCILYHISIHNYKVLSLLFWDFQELVKILKLVPSFSIYKIQPFVKHAMNVYRILALLKLIFYRMLNVWCWQFILFNLGLELLIFLSVIHPWGRHQLIQTVLTIFTKLFCNPWVKIYGG